ncbi:Hsp20/alpha crystallin family protein [Hoyosella sp. YIM 151337]|uniref:Hsp20/alpha crystallin family protein n=1 Tax=Hoyosella sp. YIM 151337 TaxID=2992742 RepID=UPI002235D45A|nr:Hsp20/alpha crystallin family protein [Hoyosella sp. YIM 151337]MCW4354470.1 Hsp20/alpha crystallin family protein [Hoyosella sp. YIM 151337]
MAVPVRRRPVSPVFGHSLFGRDPFREVEELYDRVGRWFEAPENEVGTSAWIPSADIEETDQAYTVEAELPGVKKGDITVEYRDGVLQIAGESKETARSGVIHRKTRRTGRFSYRVSLPGEVDLERIDAALTDGVLTVTLPKAAPAPESVRRIDVRS